MSDRPNLKSTPTLETVSEQELPLFLQLMADFNAEEKIDFDPVTGLEKISIALASPQFVTLKLIAIDQQRVGYVVLTFTFSFEFWGRVATIDELYILPEHRGQGSGTAVLMLLVQNAIASGATVLMADVADQKKWLPRFYQRAGFQAYPYRCYYRSLI